MSDLSSYQRLSLPLQAIGVDGIMAACIANACDFWSYERDSFAVHDHVLKCFQKGTMHQDDLVLMAELAPGMIANIGVLRRVADRDGVASDAIMDHIRIPTLDQWDRFNSDYDEPIAAFRRHVEPIITPILDWLTSHIGLVTWAFGWAAGMATMYLVQIFWLMT